MTQKNWKNRLNTNMPNDAVLQASAGELIYKNAALLRTVQWCMAKLREGTMAHGDIADGIEARLQLALKGPQAAPAEPETQEEPESPEDMAANEADRYIDHQKDGFYE